MPARREESATNAAPHPSLCTRERRRYSRTMPSPSTSSRLLFVPAVAYPSNLHMNSTLFDARGATQRAVIDSRYIVEARPETESSRYPRHRVHPHAHSLQIATKPAKTPLIPAARHPTRRHAAAHTCLSWWEQPTGHEGTSRGMEAIAHDSPIGGAAATPTTQQSGSKRPAAVQHKQPAGTRKSPVVESHRSSSHYSADSSDSSG